MVQNPMKTDMRIAFSVSRNANSCQFITLDQEGQVLLTNINNYLYEVTQTGGYKYNIA
jgi:hypothetical protein